jgi:hypothetical protein
VRTAILLTAMLVGLVFLPAWIFAAFSAWLVLCLPTARWPRVYPWLVRAIMAPAIVGISFLLSEALSVALDSGSPLRVPVLGGACHQAEQVLQIFALAVSPTCRLFLRDLSGEYGLGFFLQLSQLIQLIWIRRWNLQPSLRESAARAEGFAGICLFVLSLLTLSFVTWFTDWTLAERVTGPHDVPLGVALLFAAIGSFFVSGAQLALYPVKKRGLSS